MDISFICLYNFERLNKKHKDNKYASNFFSTNNYASNYLRQDCKWIFHLFIYMSDIHLKYVKLKLSDSCSKRKVKTK